MSGEVQFGRVLQEQEAAGLSQGLPRALAMRGEDGLMGDLVAVEEAIGGLQFGGPGEDRGHRPLDAPGAGGADLNQAPGPGGVLQLGSPK
jgi:hypothetical protein